MADPVTARVRSKEGMKMKLSDGDGQEMKHPRSNPGDLPMNRPRRPNPSVSTNS